MRKNLAAILFAVTIGGLLAFGSLVADAAAPLATNGYRVSPVRTDLTIKPGASSSLTVYIQNASSAVENLQVIVNDFQPPKDESGDPALLLNGATAPQHSLKQFIKIDTPTFTLQPGQQKPVNVAISVPAGTPGGGYYGAIRFAPVGADGTKNVNLSASVASLVLLTVPGNLSEKLTVAGFGVSQGDNTNLRSLFLNNKNLKAVVRFQNGGNVQEQPFGKIQLKKGSKVLATYNVNNSDSPGNVLPDSIRRFTINLDHIGSFGKYKIVGNFGYGSKGELLTASATFWVIPLIVIIIAAIILLLILFLIFGLPRLIRRYNRRVIAKANRANRNNYQQRR
jgi:hypothetical protein